MVEPQIHLVCSQRSQGFFPFSINIVQWISSFFLFVIFLIYRCVLVLVEKQKTALWFKEAPKSLNFLSQCNVKQLRAWKQEKGTLK